MSAFEFLAEFTDSFEYNNELRKMQINVICDSIAKIDTPIILCGDFNDIPLSYLYNKTSRILKDSFLESGFGYMYTYKHLKKLLRIDYVFHSNELRSVKYYSPNLPFSDHNPVVCELEFIN